MALNWDEHNLYELLEVSPDCSQQELQSAFKKAKATYSQENPALYGMFTPDEAVQLLGLIEEAFTVLNDPHMRKSYDMSLKVKKSKGEREGSAGKDSTNQTEFAFETMDSESAIPEADEITWDDRLKKPKSPQVNSKPHTEKASEVEISPSEETTPPKQNIESAEKFDDSKVAHTVFSSYTIDEEFEQEIAERDVFDGGFLKKVRLYKNVSLEQISETSRISRSYLIALESNDFSTLPAPVYVRGFVIQYAKALGLSTDKVSTTFLSLYKASLE